jgi:hypothetical protein
MLNVIQSNLSNLNGTLSNNNNNKNIMNGNRQTNENNGDFISISSSSPSNSLDDNLEETKQGSNSYFFINLKIENNDLNFLSH